MPAAQFEEIDAKVKAYIRRPIFRFQGFCRQLDANMLRAVIVRQVQQGISGSLVEIGVWHGKSFFILAKGRADGEKCLAVDRFETRPLVNGERQQIDAFRENCIAAAVNLAPEEMLQGDSLDLTPEDILERVGPARLVHVDGAHDFEHVRHDLEVAKAILAERGVLVVDDAFNHQWPEVAAATLEWMRGNSGLAPWAVSEQKLYLAERSYKSFYEEIVKREFNKEIGRFVELFGSKFIMLNPHVADRVRERIIRTLIGPRQVQIPRAV